jgi:hypothetical protein
MTTASTLHDEGQGLSLEKLRSSSGSGTCGRGHAPNGRLRPVELVRRFHAPSPRTVHWRLRLAGPVADASLSGVLEAVVGMSHNCWRKTRQCPGTGRLRL